MAPGVGRRPLEFRWSSLMRQSVSCPGVDEYRLLARGQTPAPASERLLAHLEECAGCARLYGTLPEGDSLADLIRQAGTVRDLSPPAAVAQLIDRLSRLRPDAPAPEGAEQPEEMLIQPPRAANESQPKERYDFLASPQTEGELGRLGPYRVL